MTVYSQRAPAGFAGGITRVDDTTVEPGFFAAANYPTAFGQPVKVAAGGKFVLMGAGSAAADFYGIVVREVPTMGATLNETFADGAPSLRQAHGIMTRGYMNVVCGVGTPTRGGKVYVRIVDGGAGKPVGQFEATADAANSVELVGVVWATEGRDTANGNIAEIRVAR